MSIIELAVNWAVGIAKDDSHGYDQINRWSPDFDCSSLVISAYEIAGVPVRKNGANSTYDMRAAFLKSGFEDVTREVNLSNGSGMKRGDVLLNDSHHTVIYIGENQVVSASINEKGTTKGGKTGDQTGREILIRSYYNYPWNIVLRYKETSGGDSVMIELPVLKEGSQGEEVKTVQRLLNSFGFRDQDGHELSVDGHMGKKTVFVLKSFQRDYRGKFGLLSIDGVVGSKTWNALLK